MRDDPTMLRATRLVRRPVVGPAPALDSITLDRQARFRRRIVVTTDGGSELLLDLPEASYLADGDALALDTGGFVRVVAAPEPLLAIHAVDTLALARIAWHLGNRHTPCEITPDAIYILPDHVLAEMVAGLGGQAHPVTRPFEPEGGAYGGHGPLHKGHHQHGAAGAQAHGHDHADEQIHATGGAAAVWRPE